MSAGEGRRQGEKSTTRRCVEQTPITRKRRQLFRGSLQRRLSLQSAHQGVNLGALSLLGGRKAPVSAEESGRRLGIAAPAVRRCHALE